MMPDMKLLIAGGGTGGHLFPGVAVAEELRARDASAEITFVGTRRGIEARVLPDLGWPLELIEVSGLKTVGALGAIRGLFRLPRAMWQARRLLVRLRPDAVIGVGGSQGAVAVNELASQALAELAKDHRLAIVHQTGEKDLDATRARYAAANVPADCRAFIKDMAAAYHDADLVIGRAGATTVAELAIAGKPAVFIPYPFAADNHQELNAREMADKGAALMFRQADLTADKLAAALRPLVDDPAKRRDMGAAMKALAKPGAAAAVIDWAIAQQR